MDPLAENSSNTLANGGGQVANDDIPKDGTGMVILPFSRDRQPQSSCQTY